MADNDFENTLPTPANYLDPKELAKLQMQYLQQKKSQQQGVPILSRWQVAAGILGDVADQLQMNKMMQAGQAGQAASNSALTASPLGGDTSAPQSAPGGGGLFGGLFGGGGGGLFGGGSTPSAPPSVPSAPPASSGQPAPSPASTPTANGLTPDTSDIASQVKNQFGFDPTSGYRSASHNADVGGAKGSQHIGGRALDYSVPADQRDAFVNWAMQNPNIHGIGDYGNGKYHLDTRVRNAAGILGGNDAWGPNYSHTSLAENSPLNAWRAGQLQPQPASVNDRSIPATIRNNNPGAIMGDGKVATFSDPVKGAAAQFDLLDRNYTGKTLRDLIGKWSGGNNADEYTKVVAGRTGLTPDTVITSDMVRNPEIGMRLAQAMSYHEAGREFPLSPAQWKQAHQVAFGGGQATPTGQPAAAPGALGQPQLPAPGGASEGPQAALASPQAPQPAVSPGVQNAQKMLGSTVKDMIAQNPSLQPYAGFIPDQDMPVRQWMAAHPDMAQQVMPHLGKIGINAQDLQTAMQAPQGAKPVNSPVQPPALSNPPAATTAPPGGTQVAQASPTKPFVPPDQTAISEWQKAWQQQVVTPLNRSQQGSPAYNEAIKARETLLKQFNTNETKVDPTSGYTITGNPYHGFHTVDLPRQETEPEKFQRQKDVELNQATATELSKVKVKPVGEAIERGTAAGQVIRDLDTMMAFSNLPEAKNITSGPFADATLRMKQMLKDWGFGGFEDVPPAEVINKLNAQLGSASVHELTNRGTQFDFKTFMANNPGLSQSPEGRAMTADILRQMAMQDQELGRRAMKLKDPSDFYDIQKAVYKELPVKVHVNGQEIETDKPLPGYAKKDNNNPPPAPAGSTTTGSGGNMPPPPAQPAEKTWFQNLNEGKYPALYNPNRNLLPGPSNKPAQPRGMDLPTFGVGMNEAPGVTLGGAAMGPAIPTAAAAAARVLSPFDPHSKMFIPKLIGWEELIRHLMGK